MTVVDSYSRYIVHQELPPSMVAHEVAEIMAMAPPQRVAGKKPTIVRDNGSQFIPKSGER